MEKCNSFSFNSSTRISYCGELSKPIKHGFEILFRDMKKIFGKEFSFSNSIDEADIKVCFADSSQSVHSRAEAFSVRFCREKQGTKTFMYLDGADELGIIYGLLHISTVYLGVDPFWFWMDKEPEKCDSIEIKAVDYISPEPRVRYRGWFVNDEDCLIGWSKIYPPTKEIWHPVFEALLRCGGNMVIPGTDLPRTGIHLEYASEMGLYITHHHAEPLGAEMFFRAYPDKEASFDKNHSLFEGLWREGIEKQKEKKVVWVVGFRGQGDCPFWEQDPSCNTPEKRGKLIQEVIERQITILSEYVKNPVCATYLYGEITELYRQGLIEFPKGVIKIWADNGYGRMVSRRNGNHNPRIMALPEAADDGPHGLYYHVAFHDLQASNHLTMLPVEPALIEEELMKAFNAGTDEYLLLNVSNIRQHVYFIKLVSSMWTKGSIDLSSFGTDFLKTYFPSAWREAGECLKEYFHCAIQYGTNPDDKAGDEFYHHPVRSIVGHWMRGETDKPAEDLRWTADRDSFAGQVEYFFQKCNAAIAGWNSLIEKCIEAASKMKPAEASLFRDFLMYQVKLHASGCSGFSYLCRGYSEFQKGNYPAAFVYVSEAKWEFHKSIEAMKDTEHGKWYNFNKADWLTNVDITVYTLDALRKYIRMFGDNPHYFLWYKEYIMPDSEKKIYLENTHRNPRSDDEIAMLLKDSLKIK